MFRFEDWIPSLSSMNAIGYVEPRRKARKNTTINKQALGLDIGYLLASSQDEIDPLGCVSDLVWVSL